MKYLIITPHKWSIGYDVQEFATSEELSEHLLTTDALAKDIIIAQRLGVSVQLCEYVPPVVEEPAKTPVIAEKEAA